MLFLGFPLRSLGFPLRFLGLPVRFHCFALVFPRRFHWFPNTFHGCPMRFLRFFLAVPMHVLGFPMHFHLFFYDFPWFPSTLSSFETSGITWGLGAVALCYPLLPFVTLCYRAGFPPGLRFCTIWGNFETAGTLTLYNTN